MTYFIKSSKLLLSAIVLFIGYGLTADAQIRSFDKIPSRAAEERNLPDGAALVGRVFPVPIEEVEAAAQALVDSWNDPSKIDEIFAKGKFDQQRFERAMITEVPRDARLELESVRSVQTLKQIIVFDEGDGYQRVSTVSATLSTRLIVNDIDVGFVNVFGLNEVRFQVTEALGAKQ